METKRRSVTANYGGIRLPPFMVCHRGEIYDALWHYADSG